MAIIAATTDRDTAAGSTLVTWNPMATGGTGSGFKVTAASFYRYAKSPL